MCKYFYDLVQELQTQHAFFFGGGGKEALAHKVSLCNFAILKIYAANFSVYTFIENSYCYTHQNINCQGTYKILNVDFYSHVIWCTILMISS